MSPRKFVANLDIPEDLMHDAAETMRQLYLQSEMEVREDARRDREVLEHLSDEIVATLNLSREEPSANLVSRVVAQVFKKYFGLEFDVRVDEIERGEAFSALPTSRRRSATRQANDPLESVHT